MVQDAVNSDSARSWNRVEAQSLRPVPTASRVTFLSLAECIQQSFHDGTDPKSCTGGSTPYRPAPQRNVHEGPDRGPFAVPPAKPRASRRAVGAIGRLRRTVRRTVVWAGRRSLG